MANNDVAWQQIATAPKDGTLLRLRIAMTEDDWETRCNPLEDTREPTPSIGFNALRDTGEDRWIFVGWDWEQDCFEDGCGTPVEWMPFDDTASAQSVSADWRAALRECLRQDSHKEQLILEVERRANELARARKA